VNAVSAGFAGEEVHQRPVQESGDDRGQQDEPTPQRRHVGVVGVAEAGVVGVAGQGEGEDLDQPSERDRAPAGARADRDGENHQAAV